MAILLTVALAVVWLVGDTVNSIRLFFGEHHGVRFYIERPQLIGLCLLVAVAITLCIDFSIRALRRTAGDLSQDVIGERDAVAGPTFVCGAEPDPYRPPRHS